jgi:hydrogenase/urease accessory protein HupE
MIPLSIHAHLVTTGLGPMFDGFGHVVVTPEDLLPVLALALLAGMGGKAYGRRVLFTLPVAWLVGGWAGMALGWALPFVATALSFLVLGGLVAANRPFEARVGTGLAVALGLVHGQMSGVEMGEAGLGLTGLFGTVGALFALVSLVTGVVVSLKRDWMRIAVRVAGSWIVAVGLLYVGWTLGGHG